MPLKATKVRKKKFSSDPFDPSNSLSSWARNPDGTVAPCEKTKQDESPQGDLFGCSGGNIPEHVSPAHSKDSVDRNVGVNLLSAFLQAFSAVFLRKGKSEHFTAFREGSRGSPKTKGE